MTDKWLADGETAEVFKLDVFEEHEDYYTCEYIDDGCWVQSRILKTHEGRKVFDDEQKAIEFVRWTVTSQLSEKIREVEALKDKLRKWCVL